MNQLKTLGAKVSLAASSAAFAAGNFLMNPGAALTAFASEAESSTTASSAASSAASSTDGNIFNDVTSPIVSLLNQITLILIPLVGAVGAVYCILLGVKFAKAEEPQEREKAKSHLKNAIIGYVLIFVLIVVLNRLTPVMQTWMAGNVRP